MPEASIRLSLDDSVHISVGILSLTLLFGLLTGCQHSSSMPHSAEQASQQIPNPAIDYEQFQSEVIEVGLHRENRRITEARFIEMAKDPSTIVLDARAADKYKMLHIKGAINLDISNFSEGDLKKIIPDKNTRILIYCNNNFDQEPVAFAAKGVSTSLNLYSFHSLYAYGYKNVYELGPYIDIRRSEFTFKGTRQSHLKSAKARLARK